MTLRRLSAWTYLSALVLLFVYMFVRAGIWLEFLIALGVVIGGSLAAGALMWSLKEVTRIK